MLDTIWNQNWTVGAKSPGTANTVTGFVSTIPEFNVSERHHHEIILRLFLVFFRCELIKNVTRISIETDIEAECQDDYMKIRIGFNGSFTGLLYSAGKHKDALSHCAHHSTRQKKIEEFFVVFLP